MKRKHVVKPGECLASVAFRYGVSPGSLWDHAANAPLRDARRDPHVLLPGDVLEIPERSESRLTLNKGQTNRYRVPIPALTLRLQVLGSDGPRRGEPFTLRVEGRTACEGTTDGDGFAELRVRANTAEGLLTVGSGDGEARIRLDFGHLNPADDTTGAQQRLNNLGLPCGPADGVIGPRTAAALRAFQARHSLPETGELDEATRAELVSRHGS